jgi:hypothetical protein
VIRTPPATDAYRDAWERVFGDGEPDEEPTPLSFATPLPLTEENLVEAADMLRRADSRSSSWPTSHESDCPARIGDPCRCPVGNL